MTAPTAPAGRIPDPAIQILHPSFAKLRIASGVVERLASGCRAARAWVGGAAGHGVASVRVLRPMLVPAVWWARR